MQEQSKEMTQRTLTGPGPGRAEGQLIRKCHQVPPCRARWDYQHSIGIGEGTGPHTTPPWGSTRDSSSQLVLRTARRPRWGKEEQETARRGATSAEGLWAEPQLG